MIGAMTPGPWRVDGRTMAEGAHWFVVAEVYTCFGSVTVRAEKSLVPMPPQAEVDAIGEANAQAIAAVPEMVEALRPFAHPDLCVALGGNAEGDASPIYQRNGATLTLGDFRRAFAALKKAGVEP